MNRLPPLRLPPPDNSRTGDAAEDLRRLQDYVATVLPRALQSWGEAAGLGTPDEAGSSTDGDSGGGGGGGGGNVEPGTVDGQILRWNDTSQLWEPADYVLLDASGQLSFVLDAGNNALDLRRTGDTGLRWRINEVGAMTWGDGAGVSGAIISKSGGNTLQITGETRALANVPGDVALIARQDSTADAFQCLAVSTLLLAVKQNANVGIRTGSQFGSGEGVIGLQNATTDPTTNPSGGGVLYASGGGLYWLGSAGTLTPIAPA